MMARMRQQFSQVLNRLPGRNATDDVPEIHLPQFGSFDLDKGNTTSVTKVRRIKVIYYLKEILRLTFLFNKFFVILSKLLVVAWSVTQTF